MILLKYQKVRIRLKTSRSDKGERKKRKVYIYKPFYGYMQVGKVKKHGKECREQSLIY